VLIAIRNLPEGRTASVRPAGLIDGPGWLPPITHDMFGGYMLSAQMSPTWDLRPIGEVLDSLRAVIVTDPRDWSIDRRDAWIYAIVCGWDEVLTEVARRHRWDDATIARLQRYAQMVAAQS
jgi:hypothetical protein